MTSKNEDLIRSEASVLVCLLLSLAWLACSPQSTPTPHTPSRPSLTTTQAWKEASARTCEARVLEASVEATDRCRVAQRAKVASEARDRVAEAWEQLYDKAQRAGDGPAAAKAQLEAVDAKIRSGVLAISYPPEGGGSDAEVERRLDAVTALAMELRDRGSVAERLDLFPP